MSGTFNGYHVWLGIPPNEQPPNHYRLLGIAGFETDLDVIDHAADRQMAHVRTFQSGSHGPLSQQILNELAVARLCLLNREKKAAYDEQLRASTGAALKVAAVPVGRALPVARPVQPTAGSPIPNAIPTVRPGASAAESAAEKGAGKAVDPIALDFDPIADSSAPAFHLRPRRRYRRGNAWHREITLAFTAALAVVTFMGLYWFYKLAASGSLGEALKSFERYVSPVSAPAEPGAEPDAAAPPAEPPLPAPVR